MRKYKPSPDLLLLILSFVKVLQLLKRISNFAKILWKRYLNRPMTKQLFWPNRRSMSESKNSILMKLVLSKAFVKRLSYFYRN